MKKTKNEGISLIVLVITIIVMIILAGTIIITLSNSGIIGKANEAVNTTNVKQIEQAATLAWADAYADGKRTQSELQAAVDEALIGVDTSKVTITVTTQGVVVTEKEGTTPEPEPVQSNVHFDEAYMGQMPEDGEILDVAFVFHRDGSVECYIKDDGIYMCYQYGPAGSVDYSDNKVAMDDMAGDVSANGDTITAGDITLTYTANQVKPVSRGYRYETEASSGLQHVVALSDNNVGVVASYYNGVEASRTVGPVTVLANGHILQVEGVTFNVSMDGQIVIASNLGVFTKTDTTFDMSIGSAKITPVEGSSEAAIKAGNPKMGDTIEYNGYIYKYNQAYTVLDAWGDAEEIAGWGVRVANAQATSYVDMESVIYNVPVTAVVATFKDCTNMVTAPALSQNAKQLGAAFYNCSKLENVVLPAETTDLTYAFYHCAELESVEIPSKVVNMACAFIGCTSMVTTPTLPNTVERMWSTFSNCTSLTTVTNLPTNLKDMSETFDGCTVLTTVPAIPANVTAIEMAFRNCKALQGTITINATAISTYSDCFNGTEKSIVLVGSGSNTELLNSLKNTSSAGNVTVQQ